MGKGIDLAKLDNPLHAQLVDDFKDQLLLVFLRRLGGEVSIPVSEIDDTGGLLGSFSIVDGSFHFKLEKKQ